MTATPATPARPLKAIIAVGIAPPAAELLEPLPEPELLAPPLVAEDAAAEAEEATDDADDLAEPIALEADAEAPEATEEADAPAPDAPVPETDVNNVVLPVVVVMVEPPVVSVATRAEVVIAERCPAPPAAPVLLPPEPEPAP